MKILIFDADYPEFIDSFYAGNPAMKNASFETQQKEFEKTAFGHAFPYGEALRDLGHQVLVVTINNETMQKTWASEHKLSERKLGIVGKLRRKLQKWTWMEEILEAQVCDFKPDVLFTMAVQEFSPAFKKHLKRVLHKGNRSSIYVIQIASKIPKPPQFGMYDLIVSPLPNQIEYFRTAGKKTEMLKLGFDPKILPKLTKGPKTYDVTHVGGYDQIHAERNKVLEALAREVRLDTWGYALDGLAPDSPIKKNFHGQAWGIEMFNILYNSKITVTGHVRKVAGDYANIMRLYEATGVGCLLLTDAKKNIGDIFEVGKEIDTYSSPEELISKVKYYLSHEDERARIAAAGQARTLRDHTYGARMKELTAILQKYLPKHGV